MKSTIKNPFLTSAEFKLKVVHTYKSSITGEGRVMHETVTRIISEQQEKVTMYKIGNNLEYTNFLFDVLNQAGRNLFMYILANLGLNRDTITLNSEKVMKAIGCTKNTLTVARQNLRDNGIITLYAKDEYWINPFFLFRGDRIEYYSEVCPECVTIAHKQSHQSKLLQSTDNDVSENPQNTQIGIEQVFSSSDE